MRGKMILVMVATRKGLFVFESNSTRKSWKMRGPYLRGMEVNEAKTDHRNGTRMFAAVTSPWWGSGIHISDDLGETWADQRAQLFGADGNPLKLNRVWAFELGRDDEPNLLYAGADPGLLLRSEDGGLSWHEVEAVTNHPTREKWQPGAGGLMVHSFALDPNDKGHMWIGISAAGVFETKDDGREWIPRNKNVIADFLPDPTYPLVGQCVHHMVGSKQNLLRLFQQNHCGVYLSDDGGEDWTNIGEGLPSRFGFAAAIHPHDDDTFYVVPHESENFRCTCDGRLGVYRSRNAGKTWELLKTGLPQKNAFLHVHRQSLVTDDLDPCGLYLGTAEGHLYYTRDEGKTWELIAQYLPHIYAVSCALLDREEQ